MTTAVYQCDGCKQYKNRSTVLWVGFQKSANQSENLRFCPDCSKKIADYIVSLEEKTAH